MSQKLTKCATKLYAKTYIFNQIWQIIRSCIQYVHITWTNDFCEQVCM